MATRRIIRLMACTAVLALFCLPAAAFLTFDGNPKWGDPALGTGAVITWSLIPDGTGVRRRPPFFPPDEPFLFHEFWTGNSNLSSIYAQLDPSPAVGQSLFLSALTGAFAAWSAATDITFVQVSDSGLALGAPGPYAGLVGDIRIGAWDLELPFDAFAAQAFQPPGGTGSLSDYLTVNSPSTFGDITLNTNAFFSVFPGLGEGDPYIGFPNDLQNLLTHEIGHALGLRHPEEDGLAPDEAAAIMRASAPTNIQRTLAADDIAGVRSLYSAAVDVPEPGSLALAGIGAIGLLGGVRRVSHGQP